MSGKPGRYPAKPAAEIAARITSMTLPEAAALLGVTAATLRQQIRNGKLRARKVGRDWSVSRQEVERYRATSSRAAQEKGEAGS